MLLRSLLPAVLLAAVAPLSADDDAVAPNYSELRERWNATTSPYLDIRRTIVGVDPGAAIPDDGIEATVRGYTIPRTYDENNRVILGTQDREEAVTAQLRQMRLLGPIGWELVGGWSASHATSNGGDPTDPFVGLTWNLVDRRHAGLTVYGGVGFPVGSGSNWIENHGGISYRGEVRGSADVGEFAVTLNAGLTETPDGKNKDAQGFVIPTTPPTIGTQWQTRFTGLDGKLLATYRLTRWLRIGVMQEVDSYYWSGTATYLSLSSRMFSAPTEAVMEVSLRYGWHLSAAGGSDVLSTNSSHGFLGELAITKTFY